VFSRAYQRTRHKPPGHRPGFPSQSLHCLRTDVRYRPARRSGPYYATEYHYVPTNAAGAFCHLTQKACFDVSAIEMDADCAHFLNEKLGVCAITSGDPAAVLAAEHYSYDAIGLWHAIKHMPTPWIVL